MLLGRFELPTSSLPIGYDISYCVTTHPSLCPEILAAQGVFLFSVHARVSSFYRVSSRLLEKCWKHIWNFSLKSLLAFCKQHQRLCTALMNEKVLLRRYSGNLASARYRLFIICYFLINGCVRRRRGRTLLTPRVCHRNAGKLIQAPRR